MKRWIRNEIGRAPALYAVVLVIAAAGAAYANSLDGGFHFDDEHHVVGNPFVHDLKYVKHYYARPDMFSAIRGHDMYRPLVLTTFGLNYHWGGYQPLVWRLTAIVLHALCSVGVFLTIRLLAMQFAARRLVTGGALVAALFFAVHPVFTETVNYASARSSLLATCFSVWAFYAHRLAAGRPRGTGRLALQVASVVLFGGALLSKEIAIVLPALLLWCAFLRRRGALAVLPLFAVALLYLWVRQTVLGTAVVDFAARDAAQAAADAGSGGARPISWNLFTQARVIGAYVLLFFWPSNLSVQRYVRVSETLWELGVVLGGLLVLGILWMGWRQRAKNPMLSLGLVWFLVALAPTSSILPLNEVMNEHRLYLPGVGLALALAGGWGALRFRTRLRLAPVAAAAAALLLVVTLDRNRDWHDSLRLWRSAARVSPRSPGAWNGIGAQLQRQGDHEGALHAFHRALKADDLYWAAVFNIGTTYLQRGHATGAYADLERAEAWFRRALGLYPRAERARWKLAETYHAMGRIEQAETAFRELAAWSPRLYELTRYPLARIALDRGSYDAAEAHYKEALREARDPVAAHLGLAEVELRRNRREDAVAHAKRAMEARPHAAGPHVFLARFYRGTALAAHHLFEAEQRGYRPSMKERRELLTRAGRRPQ